MSDKTDDDIDEEESSCCDQDTLLGEENAAIHSPTEEAESPASELIDPDSSVSRDDAAACGESTKESPDDNSGRGNKIYRSLTFRRKKASEKIVSEMNGDSKKSRKYWWSFRFKKKILQPTKSTKKSGKACSSSSGQEIETPSCVCMGYKKTEDKMELSSDIGISSTNSEDTVVSDESDSEADSERARLLKIADMVKYPVLDMSKFNPDDYPIDDLDDLMFAQRARDMAEGVDVAPNAPYHSALVAAVASRNEAAQEANNDVSGLSAAMQQNCVITTTYPTVNPTHGVTYSSESHFSEYGSLTPQGTYVPHTIHTQVDYIHCLVPDLDEITTCSFYWGVMDRYEAEKLLDSKPEGTFLLRDSAQEEFLFSVSFRRYSRSLHARIEQWNHKFSFDSHDPGVFSSGTVCGLIEHYKDPSCCMFFEPMLTLPLNRNFPFSLQHLCRSIVCSLTAYDGINMLPLPKALKEYLQYYHYKQKVRVRRFEVH